MDREIAELERRYAAEDEADPELVLRLARAYARAGRGEDAWAVYGPSREALADAELDALGRALAAEEQQRLAGFPDWLRVHAEDGVPAEALTLTESWFLTHELPRLAFVDQVSIRETNVTPAAIAQLARFPRLKTLYCEAGSQWVAFGGAGDRPRVEVGALEGLLVMPARRELRLSRFRCSPQAPLPVSTRTVTMPCVSTSCALWPNLPNASLSPPSAA